MADDVVTLMAYLGHDHFAVAGHDRGALVEISSIDVALSKVGIDFGSDLLLANRQDS